jgi:preprotein translocase subunit YajC
LSTVSETNIIMIGTLVVSGIVGAIMMMIVMWRKKRKDEKERIERAKGRKRYWRE